MRFQDGSVESTSTYSKSRLLMNHQTLIIVIVSTVGALLAAVVAILLIRWRYSRRNTDGKLTCDPLDAERGKVQEEYKVIHQT